MLDAAFRAIGINKTNFDNEKTKYNSYSNEITFQVDSNLNHYLRFFRLIRFSELIDNVYTNI